MGFYRKRKRKFGAKRERPVTKAELDRWLSRTQGSESQIGKPFKVEAKTQKETERVPVKKPRRMRERKPLSFRKPSPKPKTVDEKWKEQKQTEKKRERDERAKSPFKGQQDIKTYSTVKRLEAEKPKPVQRKEPVRTKLSGIERKHLMAITKRFDLDPQEVDSTLTYNENKNHLYELAREKGFSESEVSGTERELEIWVNQYDEYLSHLKTELEGAGYDVTEPTDMPSL